jgi:hypothetical protein
LWNKNVPPGGIVIGRVLYHGKPVGGHLRVEGVGGGGIVTPIGEDGRYKIPIDSDRYLLRIKDWSFTMKIAVVKGYTLTADGKGKDYLSIPRRYENLDSGLTVTIPDGVTVYFHDIELKD